jgi:single-stranded DNA-binding protein
MYNKVILVGRIGKDIVFKKDGGPKAIFPLSTENARMQKTGGGRQVNKQWHKIVVGGSLLKSVKNRLTKNMMLLIEGELRASAGDNPNRESGVGNFEFTNEVNALAIKIIKTN